MQKYLTDFFIKIFLRNYEHFDEASYFYILNYYKMLKIFYLLICLNLDSKDWINFATLFEKYNIT